MNVVGYSWLSAGIKTPEARLRARWRASQLFVLYFASLFGWQRLPSCPYDTQLVQWFQPELAIWNSRTFVSLLAILLRNLGCYTRDSQLVGTVSLQFANLLDR